MAAKRTTRCISSSPEVESNRDSLLAFLRTLSSTGPKGFEGLVRELIEAWCNESFRLAKTGPQDGKDATSVDDTANVIAVEMKRFHGKTSLSDRTIAAELKQVSEKYPDLEIWVLASAKELGESEFHNLQRRGQEHGIEVVVLDAREIGVGPLQVFCAEFPDIVCAFCRETVPKLEKEVRNSLSTIQSHPSFSLQSSLLRKTLQRATIGLDSTRRQAAKWLLDKVQEVHEAMATFFQDVALGDETRPAPIFRRRVSQELSAWWENCRSSEWQCALLGEEGTGKTWGVISWLLELSKSDACPIILPVTSGQLPHFEDLGEFVARILSKRLGRSDRFWSQRISIWNSSLPDTPQILLMIDGLNESPRMQWRALLEQVNSKEWKGSIALLTTCRPEYWKQLDVRGPKLITTEGYDDAELEQVLDRAGRRISEISEALRPLVLKPRYCDLVLEHFDSMTTDPTVERLLYEDYRKRLSKKRNFPVTPKLFQEILASLAEKYREGTTNLRRHDVSQFFVGVSNADAAIQEIIDGGLLVETGQMGSPLKVDRRRLIHGLGMLLADYLRDSGDDIVANKEKIETWLEPGQEMEMKGPIVAAAIFFAVINQSFPSSARQALLGNWLCRRNIPDDEEDILTAYLPECPDDILMMADILWTDTDNQLAEERITWAILQRRDHPSVKPALIGAVNRWMSFINIGGYPSGRNHEESRSKAIVSLTARLGRQLQIGDEITIGPWTFTGIDDDRKLFLSHLALKVIGAGDRLSFVEALLRWSVSRTILQHYYEGDDVAWALRLTNEPVWGALKSELQHMAKSDTEILRKAAGELLWCIGTRECDAIRNECLRGLYPKPEWLIEDQRDPCKGIFAIDRNLYEECMSRDDLPLKDILRKLDQYLPDPELQAPPTFVKRLVDERQTLQLQDLRNHPMGVTREEHEINRFLDVAARFSPKLVGDVLRAVVQDLPNRDEEQQSNLSWNLQKISMVLSDDELSLVRNALSLMRSANIIEKQKLHAESDATLALLYHLSPEEGVMELLVRPSEAEDDVELFEIIQQVSVDKGNYLLNQLLSDSDRSRLRRVLWLLPAIPPNLVTKENEQILTEYLLGEDLDLCCGAIRFAYFSRNEALAQAVIQNETRWFNKNSSRVYAYRSAIVMSRAADLPLEYFMKWLSLGDLIRVISIRACPPIEIQLLADILSAIILPADHEQSPPQENLVSCIASREQHSLHTRLIQPKVMAALHERCPDQVRRWTALALNDDQSTVLHIHSGFYYSLCGSLLQCNSEDGIQLWRKIDSITGTRIVSSGIDWLVFLAFAALPQQAGKIICEELVQKAVSDIELCRIMLAASEYGQEQWVIETAENLLRTPHLWRRGKGLMLIAFSFNYSRPFEDVAKEADLVGTWLETPSEVMGDIFDRNQWGKHWYRIFLTAGEEDEAYCAWRLFLKCVDGRGRSWMEELEAEYCLPGSKAAKRKQFRQINDRQVTHAIEDREKEYTGRFLTISMSSSERDRVSPYFSNTQD